MVRIMPDTSSPSISQPAHLARDADRSTLAEKTKIFGRLVVLGAFGHQSVVHGVARRIDLAELSPEIRLSQLRGCERLAEWK
jgi:hypothetical protein